MKVGADIQTEDELAQVETIYKEPANQKKRANKTLRLTSSARVASSVLNRTSQKITLVSTMNKTWKSK